MIKSKQPLTLAEVTSLVGDSEKAEKMKAFSKEFTKLKAEKAIKYKQDLAALELVKLNEENIVSLVNFIPKDAQDVIKILEGISLDQEEVNKVLEVFKS